MLFDQQSLIQQQLESLSRDDDYSPKKTTSSPSKRKYKPRLKKTPSPKKAPSRIKLKSPQKMDINLSMLKAAEKERIENDCIIGEPYVPVVSRDSEATDSEKTDEMMEDDDDSDADHYIKTHFHALKNSSVFKQSGELNKETKGLPVMIPAIIDGQLRCITEQEYLKTPVKMVEDATEDDEDDIEFLRMKEIQMLNLHDEKQKQEAILERQKKIKDQIIKNTEIQELKKTQNLLLTENKIIDQNIKSKVTKEVNNNHRVTSNVQEKENIKEIITPNRTKLDINKKDKKETLPQKTIHDLNTLIKRKTNEVFEDEKVDSEIKKKLTVFGSSENNNEHTGIKRKMNDKEISGMPDLKRTRSIDGAKLRSINFIMPLQKSLTQDTIKKDQILINNKRKVSNENKIDSKSLLKLVTMTKKEQIIKQKAVNPVIATQTSNQGDSDKWKSSWRAVLAENKTITVIRDISKKMSYNEEKLLSVVQAGFLSLGSLISPELSEKTFILVIGSEESEVKSPKMKEIVNQAQRRGCKVWNLQKSRRFFKHLDIEVEEMEKDYEMMRYIDYAKYKKMIPVKSVEPAALENKISGVPQTNKLNEYLSMESKIGNLDRDITAKREDHHYFSEEKPHMYLYYKNQQFAPIVSMEWKCPTTEEEIFKEKYDLDALPYPTIKYSYNGRSPFSRRDKEEILYQKAFHLNNRGKEPIEITRHSDPNQKTVTKKLINHRYEKDLLKEDYALMIRRLYSESSIPNAENNVYFFDNYYDKENELWVPFNNTLSKMYPDHDIYEEKKNLSMTLKKHNESFNTSDNMTLQSPLPEKAQQWMNVTQSPNKDGTTKYEDVENLSQRPILQRVNTQHMSEMKASGVLVGTNMGTGNGLQPVKNSIISAQMKVLQKRQLVLQKQMALQKQQQKKDDGKGKNGYCEGCRVKYDDLEKHIKSERHISYKNDEKNFTGIDELIRLISI